MNNYINQITLDCLLNKEYNITVKSPNNKNNKYEKKFYRKRIYDLTKKILLSKENEVENISPDVIMSFENFINECIKYFKTIDKNDFIQDEYKKLNVDNINIPMTEVKENVTNIYLDIDVSFNTMLNESYDISKNVLIQQINNNDQLLFNNDYQYTNDISVNVINKADDFFLRSILVNKPTLDNFVKLTKTKKEDIIIPKRKKINLYDPILKNKGIEKKKNITNSYDENKNKKNKEK